MANKKTAPEEKQFSLKDIELRSIANINARANAAMLDFVTFIALERLAINVTEHTQFRVEDGKMYVTEIEPEETPEEKPSEEVTVA